MKVSFHSVAAVLSVGIAAFVTPVATAHFGWNKTKTRLPIHHPPVVVLADSLQLQVNKSQGGFTVSPVLDQAQTVLRARITNALQEMGKKIDAGPQKLDVTIARLEANIEDKHLRKSYMIQIGTKPIYNKKGEHISDQAQCAQRESIVTQREWTATGDFLLQLTEVKKNLILYSNIINVPVHVTSVLDAPDQGACGNVDRNLSVSLPTNRDDLAQHVVNRGSDQILARLRGYDESREALLAVCDELKTGNSKAQAGDLRGAIQDWESVRAAKTKHLEPYRKYNIAVAKAVLALTETDTAEANKDLEEARQLQTAAISGDPTEKYFREFPALANDIQQILDTQQKQEFERRKALEEAAAEATARDRWLTQSLDPKVYPDEATAEQREFRQTVRFRLSTLDGSDVPATLRDELGRQAQRIGVDTGDMNRIIKDENIRRAAVAEARKDYTSILDTLARGRNPVRLTRDERESLDHQIQQMHLTAAMVGDLEQARGIQSPEPGSAVKNAATVKPKPPAPRKSAVTPKSPPSSKP